MNKIMPEENNYDKRWVEYRPETKVLDCTVRDGGLMNDHRFTHEQVGAIYRACAAAGVDYFEIGYKGSKKVFGTSEYGPWKFCDEEDIRRAVGEKIEGTKISVMADAEKCDFKNDIPQSEESFVDMVRVAAYIHQVPLAIEMIEDAHDKGYETTFNLMAVSTADPDRVEEALRDIARTPVGTIYVVDSFGYMHRHDVAELTAKYLGHARVAGKVVGMHAHNNQQMAFANTVTAVEEYADMLDASIGGLGRGAGNCPMELLLGFLHNPKFKARPILECFQEHIEPLKEDVVDRLGVNWGYHPAYGITGQINHHPKTAMAFMETKAKAKREIKEGPNILEFYDTEME